MKIFWRKFCFRIFPHNEPRFSTILRAHKRKRGDGSGNDEHEKLLEFKAQKKAATIKELDDSSVSSNETVLTRRSSAQLNDTPDSPKTVSLRAKLNTLIQPEKPTNEDYQPFSGSPLDSPDLFASDFSQLEANFDFNAQAAFSNPSAVQVLDKPARKPAVQPFKAFLC